MLAHGGSAENVGKGKKNELVASKKYLSSCQVRLLLVMGTVVVVLSTFFPCARSAGWNMFASKTSQAHQFVNCSSEGTLQLDSWQSKQSFKTATSDC